MREVTLGEILFPRIEEVVLKTDESYATAGILSYGRGLFERPVILGSETRYRSYFRVRSGDFVYSKLFAWEGALTTVPTSFDGFFVSQEFPTFQINPELAEPEFIHLICQLPGFWNAVRGGQTGMGGRRKRVHPAFLLTVMVPLPPLPPLSEQRRIVDLIAALDQAVEAASVEAADLQSVISAMSSEMIDYTNPVPLGDLVSISAKLADPKRPEYHNLPYVDIEAIQSRIGDTRQLSTVGEAAPISSKYLFTPDEVIYSKIRPELRKVAFPRVFGMCSADAYPLRVGPRMMPEFLFEVLLTERFSDAAIKKSGRTKMPKINRNELLSIEVPAPDLTIQREISRTLGALRLTAKAASTYISRLLALRAALLDELLSGEHEIPASYDALLTA